MESNETMIIVQQTEIHQLDQIAVLFDKYRLFYGQEPDLDGARMYLYERFSNQQSIIFGAWNGDRNNLLGFAQLYPSFSSISMERVWILNDLFVNEQDRGKGVAKCLINKVIEFSTSTRSRGISLSTGIINRKAQRIYESIGFEKDDQFSHYFLGTKQ